MDNIIYMLDIPLFTYDGYADVMEDGTQYQALDSKDFVWHLKNKIK